MEFRNWLNERNESFTTFKRAVGKNSNLMVSIDLGKGLFQVTDIDIESKNEIFGIDSDAEEVKFSFSDVVEFD